jgi:3-hydroxy-9,10-secoandrosta-1,3,5(10)-triene-9,17-dione monooxygenase
MFVPGPRFSLNYRGMTIPYEEAIERARSIVPVAKKNASAAEELKRLPEENIKAIQASGLMPLMRPKMFGGYEADWMTQIDCVSEVAAACGSSGWCMTFMIQHQVFLSLFPEVAQRAVYDQNPDPMILTSFNPTGQVKAVNGGYEVSGRWRFGSVGDYCDWAILGAVAKNEDGTSRRFNLLLKPGQFKIERVWNSVGLKGSGSNDILVEPTFVPHDYTYGLTDAMLGRAPGQQLYDGILYRTPFVFSMGFAVMTPMHGIARGAYESFVEYISAKAAGPRGKTSELDNTQTAIGESKAEIDLAYLVTEKMSATTFNGAAKTREDAVRQRRDMVLVRSLLLSAVDRLFAMSGAHGLEQHVALQRHWRDLHAIGNHSQWTAPAVQVAGRDALKMPPLPNDVYQFQ